MKSSLALIRSSGLDIGAVGVCIIRTYVACIWPSAGLALIRVIFSFFIARRDIRERERETTHEVSYTHAACRKYLILRGNKRCKFQIFFSLFFFSWDFRWIIYMKLLNDKNAVDRYARSLRKRETAGIFFFFASHTCVCRKCLSREILSDRKTSSYETN